MGLPLTRVAISQMEAHKVMRLSLDEMYSYLNAKRDTEIATFRQALFAALHTKGSTITSTDKDGKSTSTEEALDSSNVAANAMVQDEITRRKRMDELQGIHIIVVNHALVLVHHVWVLMIADLVRLDEIHRRENPELPKMLNILAMDEIERQVCVSALRFVHVLFRWTDA